MDSDMNSILARCEYFSGLLEYTYDERNTDRIKKSIWNKNAIRLKNALNEFLRLREKMRNG
jgi:hypothetical protein